MRRYPQIHQCNSGFQTKMRGVLKVTDSTFRHGEYPSTRESNGRSSSFWARRLKASIHPLRDVLSSRYCEPIGLWHRRPGNKIVRRLVLFPALEGSVQAKVIIPLRRRNGHR